MSISFDLEYSRVWKRRSIARTFGEAWKGGPGGVREGVGGLVVCERVGRQLSWKLSEKRENSRKSVKARDTFRMRSRSRNITVAVDDDRDIFAPNI